VQSVSFIIRPLTLVDEATVRDRERLVNEYGVRSIIDLRTKYARRASMKRRTLTVVGLSTSNKLKSETQKSRHQQQSHNPTMMSLDR
jgi:hypothetical protein